MLIKKQQILWDSLQQKTLIRSAFSYIWRCFISLPNEYSSTELLLMNFGCGLPKRLDGDWSNLKVSLRWNKKIFKFQPRPISDSVLSFVYDPMNFSKGHEINAAHAAEWAVLFINEGQGQRWKNQHYFILTGISSLVQVNSKEKEPQPLFVQPEVPCNQIVWTARDQWLEKGFFSHFTGILLLSLAVIQMLVSA